MLIKAFRDLDELEIDNPGHVGKWCQTVHHINSVFFFCFRLATNGSNVQAVVR